MKILLSLLLLFSFSCQKEEKPLVTADAVSSAATTEELDFEKKKKDESCSTEEDLEKQIEAAKKEPKAFQLQGGDPGCTVK